MLLLTIFGQTSKKFDDTAIDPDQSLVATEPVIGWIWWRLITVPNPASDKKKLESRRQSSIDRTCGWRTTVSGPLSRGNCVTLSVRCCRGRGVVVLLPASSLWHRLFDNTNPHSATPAGGPTTAAFHPSNCDAYLLADRIQLRHQRTNRRITSVARHEG